MELFDRLFTKRNLVYTNYEPRKRDRSRQIAQEQVRLLLFKECDWRGRKLLFDSSTIEIVPAKKDDKTAVRNSNDVSCIVEITDGHAYVYKGPAADASVLGEMIFGAVAMNHKGVSLKIHIMDEPRRLMCTKVFCVPTTRKISRVDRKSDVTSTGDFTLGSKPMTVTSLREESMAFSFSLDRGDSGFCGDQSPYSSIGSTRDYFSMFDLWDGIDGDEVYFHSPPGRKLSTSSNGSWQRRTFQNAATKFDLSCSTSNLLNVPTASSNSTSCDSQVYSNSSTSGTTDSLASNGSNAAFKKNKLGLALLITVANSAEMDAVKYCVEHSQQLQAVVCRLRLATVAAGAGQAFVATLCKAASDAARWLSDLMYGPRLQPLWLSMATSDARAATKMADILLNDLCSVLAMGDTKHTNFFISTLLTHVLTYHLGWVTTVSPYDTIEVDKNGVTHSKRHYNALWAQLSDLCGSIGFPQRSARTIVCGSATNFINKLLAVLTYFLRSGDVTKTEYQCKECDLNKVKVVNLTESVGQGMKRKPTVNKLSDLSTKDSLKVPLFNTQSSDSSVSSLATSDVTIKRSTTLANLSQSLSANSEFCEEENPVSEKPMTSLRRNPTMVVTLNPSPVSSLNSSVSEEFEAEQKVVFVLGDDEKLVGLKNKSNGGKSVKKSTKCQENCEMDIRKQTDVSKSEIEAKRESPSKCCAQKLQHSKPIKHSGYKFEFDKYPQIVTNYMKSKNLEILDRHYIGKPGNLKLSNFQFDPTVVPSIQEERCETCYKCQQMESMLQTPTNASEMEYMNDMPRNTDPQYAKQTVVTENNNHREMSPKTFVRIQKENTIVVNVKCDLKKEGICSRLGKKEIGRDASKLVRVKQIVEVPTVEVEETARAKSGITGSLLGALTDHYVPDLVLQGTIANPVVWETELRRDLDLSMYMNKSLDTPIQTVAIIGDTNTWEVRVIGRDCGTSGMSSLVAAILDTLPAMWRAKVPAHLCLSFLESKLRDLCVLSKTLADMLMSTDFCDIATLTKSLNIDVNDVPLLLAVATTHTPQVATRYGISYR